MHIESLSIQGLAINKSWDGDIPSYLSFDYDEDLLYEEILVCNVRYEKQFINNLKQDGSL